MDVPGKIGEHVAIISSTSVDTAACRRVHERDDVGIRALVQFN